MKYLINLSYDGSEFYGYQIQKNYITVQGELEKSLSKILNENIKTTSSSRTDRGVHTINQYCHFEIDKEIDITKLKKSLNSIIDKSIYINNISLVDDSFSARYSVKNKIYIYKINMGKYNPIERNYCLQYNKKIDKRLIKKFISIMNGKHNFKSFTSDKNNNNYERNILIKYEINDDILALTFSSKGFLRYMIRNIVGLLLDINENKKSLEDINNIFKSNDRASLGLCASPVGLYLKEIEFY